LTLVVEDIMARDVVTIEANFSVKYAARVMSLYGISSVIVLDDGKMKGILT
jgi:CBS domain-containing protein